MLPPLRCVVFEVIPPIWVEGFRLAAERGSNSRPKDPRFFHQVIKMPQGFAKKRGFESIHGDHCRMTAIGTPNGAGLRYFQESFLEYRNVPRISVFCAALVISVKGYNGEPLSVEIHVAADRQRFVGVITAGSANSNDANARTDEIQVVLNWFEELKARVPTK